LRACVRDVPPPPPTMVCGFYEAPAQDCRWLIGVGRRWKILSTITFMRELFRVVEEPRSCSYLPAERASLEYKIVTGLDRAEYEEFLARGYRRFGYQLFRPACQLCQQCVSLRILVQEFSPGRSERRVLRRNADVRVVRQPVFVTSAHLDLFNRYHRFMARHRGWQRDLITRESYLESFALGGDGFAFQWMFYEQERLIGVALMDETAESISLVYCFYDPSWRTSSPGTFAVLTQLEYAKGKSLRYAYPGYWIAASPSMSYKNRFTPYERLKRHPPEGEAPVWVRC
jgi:leucyl-tRNA---protein transferase